MVFVPSDDGTTVNEAEFTEWQVCVTGASVHANAVPALAGD